jgi:hypothetical protein
MVGINGVLFQQTAEKYEDEAMHQDDKKLFNQVSVAYGVISSGF